MYSTAPLARDNQWSNLKTIQLSKSSCLGALTCMTTENRSCLPAACLLFKLRTKALQFSKHVLSLEEHPEQRLRNTMKYLVPLLKGRIKDRIPAGEPQHGTATLMKSRKEDHGHVRQPRTNAAPLAAIASVAKHGTGPHTGIVSHQDGCEQHSILELRPGKKTLSHSQRQTNQGC